MGNDFDSDDCIPFYANPNAPSDRVRKCNVPQVNVSNAEVFDGAAGTVPPFPANVVGRMALNEQTNEQWFVNNSFEWQLQIQA